MAFLIPLACLVVTILLTRGAWKSGNNLGSGLAAVGIAAIGGTITVISLVGVIFSMFFTGKVLVALFIIAAVSILLAVKTTLFD